MKPIALILLVLASMTVGLADENILKTDHHLHEVVTEENAFNAADNVMVTPQLERELTEMPTFKPVSMNHRPVRIIPIDLPQFPQFNPTAEPTFKPVTENPRPVRIIPIDLPQFPQFNPTAEPTYKPVAINHRPVYLTPVHLPQFDPTREPSTKAPTVRPTRRSRRPTRRPTGQPSSQPTA